MKTLLTPEEADRVFDLVAEAGALEPEQRAAFLTQACVGADGLRAEVESLLGFKTKAPRFLENPAFDRGLELLGFGAENDLKPGDTLGDYRVLSLLGSGGMGEVFLADDAVHGRQVALKLIGHGRNEEMRGRHFRHERKVLAALNHPHIARLYGSGVTAKGQAYLVMEYVEGERLDRYCQDQALDVTARLAIFRKVCAAVSYAHQNLVVHRDLKPANIRVTPEGEPKLLDFGIAKLLDPEGTVPRIDPTVTMQGAMTPEYASPEQIKGAPITTASDVYSLGVVLYELLTGQRPYAHLKSRRPDELARAICEEEPPHPSTVVSRAAPTTVTATVPAGQVPAARLSSTRLRRRLEGDLDNVVAKALRKEPARRYTSVAAFSEDIRRHGEGLPVSARQDTLGYRAGKFVRRHKTGVTAAALVVVSMVTGLVTAIWQARLAGQERDRAQAALTQAKLAQRQVEQVDDFLQNLLASADPKKLGKDVRMVQVIDAAAATLDHDLANEPEVLVQAHLTLSRTYRNLGLFEPAEQQARAAFTLICQLHGKESPTAARIEAALGYILANRRKVAEAEPMLRHALSIYRAQIQPDRAALADVLASLSYTLTTQPGRSAEADATGADAVAYAHEMWGERNPNYLRVLNQFATTLVGDQEYAKAAETFRQILTIQDQITPDTADTLSPQWNLCICLYNLEKLGEMEVALKRLDADIQRFVDENSLQSTIANVLHGLLNYARGKNGVAIPYLQKALGALSASYPPDALTVVQCRAVLGLCLTRDNRAAEGEKLLQAAYDQREKVSRSDFAHTFGNLDTALGECLLAQKRYPESEPLLLTGYGDLEKRLGLQNRLTIQAADRLHALYLAWNKPEQAARFVAAQANLPAAQTP